eukprot:CFRG0960T1
MSEAANPLAKFGNKCPYLDENHHVAGCPAFKDGCPFKMHTCPFKEMTHDEAMAIIAKCPHITEHLAKCPMYRPDQKEGCPFVHDGHMDISKCPHFKSHVNSLPEGHAAVPEGTKVDQCPFIRMQHKANEKHVDGPAEDQSHIPDGHPPVKGGDVALCPFMQMQAAAKK